jgi:outer membrane protein assembly factor BamE (lipoprotein component of BamABCDE complex)
MNTQIVKLLPALAAALALSACASFSEQTPGEGSLAKIEPGLTQADVQGIVGRPANVTHNSRSGASLWIYSFTDTWGYTSEFDIAFDRSGRVADVYAKRDNE